MRRRLRVCLLEGHLGQPWQVGALSPQEVCPQAFLPPPWPAHSLFAFFIDVIDLIPAGERKESSGCRAVHTRSGLRRVRREVASGCSSHASHAHSLVGGMAVTDHLGQDPLLIPIHGLDPGSHLVSRFGHVVPRGWNGPTEWGWSEGG